MVELGESQARILTLVNLTKECKKLLKLLDIDIGVEYLRLEPIV